MLLYPIAVLYPPFKLFFNALEPSAVLAGVIVPGKDCPASFPIYTESAVAPVLIWFTIVLVEFLIFITESLIPITAILSIVIVPAVPDCAIISKGSVFSVIKYIVLVWLTLVYTE